MTTPAEWRGAADPAHLFLLLWHYVAAMRRERLMHNIQPSAAVARAFKAALAHEAGTVAVGSMCDALEQAWRPGDRYIARRERAGLALAAMQAIDLELLAIHPRSTLPTGMRRPAWLEDCHENRLLTGAFAAAQALSLIARGPLLRSPRQPYEEASFVLVDHFCAVKVVDMTSFVEDGRNLEVAVTVIDQSADRGVPGRRGRRGREWISFVPLAEASDDLIAEICSDGDQLVIDVRKGRGFAPAVLLAGACQACANSDIVLAPELTVDPSDVAAVGDALSRMRGDRPRLVVAGSGLTTERDGPSGLPHNESSILNGNGAILWRHRKLMAYAMLDETSKDLELPGFEGGAALLERIAWSDQMTIADVEGLGRCIVLICQDLKMGVVKSLLEEFRPDWLLVPILDSGTSLSRWPARRARELAGIGETRFAVVSSLTMKCWMKTQYPGTQMGVAVGPTTINRVDANEDLAGTQTEVAPEAAQRRFATVRWRSASGWTTR